MGGFTKLVGISRVGDCVPTVWRLAQYVILKNNDMKTAKEIKEELEKEYGWNFSSKENMEMYYELFIDVQKVVLRQQLVVGRSEQLVSFLKWVGDGYDFENNAEKIVKEYIDEGN
jgi:hypothetical protein